MSTRCVYATQILQNLVQRRNLAQGYQNIYNFDLPKSLKTMEQKLANHKRDLHRMIQGDKKIKRTKRMSDDVSMTSGINLAYLHALMWQDPGKRLFPSTIPNMMMLF